MNAWYGCFMWPKILDQLKESGYKGHCNNQVCSWEPYPNTTSRTDQDHKTQILNCSRKRWWDHQHSHRVALNYRPPYMINFIVKYSTLYEVIDRVWTILMQKSFITLLISIILPQ